MWVCVQGATWTPFKLSCNFWHTAIHQVKRAKFHTLNFILTSLLMRSTSIINKCSLIIESRVLCCDQTLYQRGTQLNDILKHLAQDTHNNHKINTDKLSLLPDVYDNLLCLWAKYLVSM